MQANLGEMLPVVNRADQEVGFEFRSNIHRLGLMHRTVHVLVFDRHGRLYLQKRSQKKDMYPGLWTSSASGHVDIGEGYVNAAYRELREELNLVLPCRYLGTLSPQPATDQAFAAVYCAVTRQEPMPNFAEISAGSFFARRAAWQIARNRSLAVPALKLVLAMAGRRGCW